LPCVCDSGYWAGGIESGQERGTILGMARIDIMGVSHTYELTPAGSSPQTLVFIHGWLLSREYWQPVISQLSASFQCLSYDLRGFGQSQPTEEVLTTSVTTVKERLSTVVDHLVDSPYTASAYANDLAILLEKLNIKSAWLIGHSLGGTIALWGAAQFPECVQGVICINSGGGIYLKEAFEQFRKVGQQMLKFRPRWLGYAPLINLMLTRVSVSTAIAPHWGRQRLIDFVVADAKVALGTLLDSTTEEEINCLPQLVAQLQQPVYFIAGAEDQIMEPKYVRHLASFHPLFQCSGENVIEIPHCGHLAMIEQPLAVANRIEMIVNQH